MDLTGRGLRGVVALVGVGAPGASWADERAQEGDRVPLGTAVGVRNAGRKPGEVAVIGQHLFQQTVQDIKDGYVTMVADQHPYLQQETSTR